MSKLRRIRPAVVWAVDSIAVVRTRPAKLRRSDLLDFETRLVLLLRRKSFWKRISSRVRQWEVERDRDYYTVLSYPKSGRSWLRFMLCHIESAISGRPLGRYIHGVVNRRRKEPKFYYVHGVSPHQDLSGYHYERLWYNPPAGVIFLVRDPVKVVASFYAHLKTKKFFGIRLDEGCRFKNFIADPKIGIRRYEEYLAFYVQSIRKSGVPVLMLRYEDLLADTKHELGRILRFSELPANEAVIGQIVEAASFEKMRAAEEQNLYKAAWLAPGKKGDASSLKTRGAFRKGRYVEYEDEERALVEAILKRSPIFKAFGYSAEGIGPYHEADVYDAITAYSETV